MNRPVPDADLDARASAREERVLVLTHESRDGATTVSLLASVGIQAEVCSGIRPMAEALDGAGAALLSEEVLGPAELLTLTGALAHQPAWSDFPFIVFGGPRAGDPGSPVLSLGNVSLLDRPVRVRSMIAAVRSALRARRRQYEARREIRARDQFLAMLGHELRNPLAAIGVAAELMSRGGDGDERARHRSVIDRQSKHLGRLVDDLLDVSRVTHGKVKLDRAVVDLCDVLRSGAQALEHVVKAKRTKLEIVAPGRIDVFADRLRLEQIVGNLLGNAVKYTPDGGSVRAEVGVAGPMAELRVEDTGVGIDAEMLPRVFDLFVQAEQSLERKEGGMGLGLTLVQRLVVLHGGTIEAKSEGLGRGSEFHLRMPLATEAQLAAVASSSPPPSAVHVGPRRVVLVDDNDDIRELFEELLSISGHQVSSGADGPGGVAAILEAQPQVAFVDVGLPGFDGYEVARRVRAELGGGIVLVAMTGYGQTEDRQRSLDAGFDRHLTKPVDVKAIEALVQEAPVILRRRLRQA